MSRFRNHVVFIIFLSALAVVLVGCSGGSQDADGDSGGDRAAQEKSAPTIEEFAGVIVENLGPDDGFTAVVLAYDKGYSLPQIVSAGLAGDLGVSGEIDGIDPEFSAAGRFTAMLPNQPRAVFASQHLVDTLEGTADISLLRGWLTKFEETDRAATLLEAPIILIVKLMAAGYSPEQIQEAVLFGYTIDSRCGSDSNCYEILEDETGKSIFPDRSRDESTFSGSESSEASGSATDGAATGSGGEAPAPDEDLAGTVYRGSGQITTKYDPATETTGICAGRETIEIRFLPGGKVTLTGILGYSGDGQLDGSVVCTGVETSYQGTYANGKFRIPPPYEGFSGEITGEYDGNKASFSGSFYIMPQTISYEFEDLEKQ